MSAEIVPKKRGRPRKVVVAQDVEVEQIVKETKTKSTTTKTTRTRKPKTPPKDVEPSKSLPIESAEISQPIPVAAITSMSSSTSEPQTMRAKPAVAPKSSKILEQVRELSTKASKKSPESTSIAQKAVESPAKSTAASSNASSASKSSPPIQTKTAPKQPTKPFPTSSNPPPNSTKPKIPLAAFNSAIVSNISERAGARPNTSGSQALPKGYQNTARKVTMTIVALPIAIVTSYVLYQRLVLGEEKQLLVAPRTTEVPSASVSVKDNE